MKMVKQTRSDTPPVEALVPPPATATAPETTGAPDGQTTAVPEAPTTISRAARALEHKAQYEADRAQAIEEILTQMHDLRTQLTDLDYEYALPVTTPVPTRHITTRHTRPARAGVARTARRASPSAIFKGDSPNPCRVCGQMGHDARTHRKDNLARLAKQGKRKKK